MRFCFLGLWGYFVEAKIRPHIIFLTGGELGISKNSSVTPAENMHIRNAEASRAADFFGATTSFLNFPDLNLPFVPFEKLVFAVMLEVQKVKSDALFSFHPHEITQEFDHLDHSVAGMVTRHVGAAADVKHFFPDHTSRKSEHHSPNPDAILDKRPELYLWTSSEFMANTTLPLSAKIRQKRNQYLIDHYPSQFPASNKDTWVPIFDSITGNSSKNRKSSRKQHSENYMRVR